MGLLNLAKAVLDETFRTLRDCGRAECECAVYWTGPAIDDSVDRIEHPLHRRSPFGYQVDDQWLTEFWGRLAKEERSIKAQIHTHPSLAFHSITDDQWPIVSQAGFLSIVIPDYATGMATFDRTWIGRLTEDGRWREAAAPEQVLKLV